MTIPETSTPQPTSCVSTGSLIKTKGKHQARRNRISLVNLSEEELCVATMQKRMQKPKFASQTDCMKHLPCEKKSKKGKVEENNLFTLKYL